MLPYPLQPSPDADTSAQLPAATDQLQCQVQDDLCSGWHPHHDDQRTQGLCQRAQGGTPTNRWVCTPAQNCKFCLLAIVQQTKKNKEIVASYHAQGCG